MIICYAHGGSDNHGCEAIIRGTNEILEEQILLFSGNRRADEKYKLNEVAKIRSDSYKRYYHPVRWFFYKTVSVLSRKSTAFMLVDGEVPGIYLFVGGDNYCYQGLVRPAVNANRRIRGKGKKTVLWGASIEPDMLDVPEIMNDIRQYDLIFARESLTYRALVKHGLEGKTYLFPDPAFAMQARKKDTGDNLFSRPVVGINISPMIMKYTEESDKIKKGYIDIIKYVLEHTACHIALIPHVVKKNSNDFDTIVRLAEEIADDRVYIIEDGSAEELKYIISRCEFFVGARTHSTIAAYSSCVPTLVIGYSVKARGIAKDIFGTDEKYVIDVRTLSTQQELLDGFRELFAKRQEIRKYLEEFMPGYNELTKQAAHVLQMHMKQWTE